MRRGGEAPDSTAAHQAPVSPAVSRSLLKFMSIQSDAIQPSHPLLPFSSAFKLSQHQALFFSFFLNINLFILIGG